MIMQIPQPILSYRFIVEFHSASVDQTYLTLCGNDKLLSMSLMKFSFDDCSKEFWFTFRLPEYSVKELYDSLDLLESFTHSIVDENGIRKETRDFTVDHFVQKLVDYDYASNDAVELKVKGIYK